MADTKISAATSTIPAATDLIPLERPSSAVARYATIAAIVQAQAASTGEKGAVELATLAEMRAGASTSLVATPEGVSAVAYKVYNAASYGAVAGSDSTSAIQAALDAAGVAGGGLVVVEPNSSAYLLSAAGTNPYASGHKYALNIAYDNVHLEIRAGAILKLADGAQVDGAPVDIIVFRDRKRLSIFGGGRITGNTVGQAGWSGGYTQITAGCIISGYATTANGNYDILIENLELDDHWSNPVNISYQTHYNNHRITLRNLFAHGVGEGFQVISGDDVLIDGCRYDDTENVAAGDPFEVATCRNVRVNNCHVSNVATGGTAFDLYGCIDAVLTNFTIYNAFYGIGIESSAGAGGYAANRIIVANGIIDTLQSTGVGLVIDSAGVTNATISNLYFYDCPNGGIQVAAQGTKNAGPVTINNVSCVSCSNGILINGATKNLTIANCQLFSNDTAGIHYEVNGAESAADTTGLKIIGSISTGNIYGLVINTAGIVGYEPSGLVVFNDFSGNTANIAGNHADGFKNLKFDGNYPVEIQTDPAAVIAGVYDQINPVLGFATINSPAYLHSVLVRFSSSLTVTDLTQAGGNNINLAGSVNMSAVAGNYLCLQFDGTNWVELWRRV